MRTPCYIFDIDGTIADGSHRLHHIQTEPKDWDTFFSKVDRDVPIAHVIQLARDLHISGNYIAYVSGRSDVCRDSTAAWLRQHGLTQGPLYMRKAGDHKDDDKLKIELLADLRRDGFEPIMVFDDRNRVVAAWRAAGIPCAQVAEGDF